MYDLSRHPAAVHKQRCTAHVSNGDLPSASRLKNRCRCTLRRRSENSTGWQKLAPAGAACLPPRGQACLCRNTACKQSMLLPACTYSMPRYDTPCFWSRSGPDDVLLRLVRTCRRTRQSGQVLHWQCWVSRFTCVAAWLHSNGNALHCHEMPTGTVGKA